MNFIDSLIVIHYRRASLHTGKNARQRNPHTMRRIQDLYYRCSSCVLSGRTIGCDDCQATFDWRIARLRRKIGQLKQAIWKVKQKLSKSLSLLFRSAGFWISGSIIFGLFAFNRNFQLETLLWTSSKVCVECCETLLVEFFGPAKLFH